MNTTSYQNYPFIKINRSSRYHLFFSTSLKLTNRILLVTSIYLIFGLLAEYVYADNHSVSNIDPYHTQHGSVWLLPENGTYIEAMQMQTDVDFKITGPVARARVKQQFINNSAFWAEGIYVFPLPEKAAVDQFKMIIGDRVIEGQVKKRAIAKATYLQAKSAGKKTSLIEQQRPNVFTTSLANIAPGEDITIEFEYQQTLDYKDGNYRLRYPMVVGPRYHASSSPMSNINKHGNSPEEGASNTSNTNITSVYTETDTTKNTNNPTRIHILLDAGVSLAELASSYHKIHIMQTGDTRYSISTHGENIIANRDFELVWKPELNNVPQFSAFNETAHNEGTENESYTMVTLLPPDLNYLEQKVQARDVIFVLDTSGSMSGTSIEQAKASLITALDGLSSIDRFNIIWFNNETSSMFPESVPADKHYKNYATLFIEQLQAGGGTEMLPALELALSNQQEFSRFRQVIFITDGNINNVTQLFNVIDKKLGYSRLFTIGIGSAPNAYFMRKAAEKGRGTFTYIGDINEVSKKTGALFKKLEKPALVNIQLKIDGNATDKSSYEVFPDNIPDIYAGEPLTLLIKSTSAPKSITLSGDYGNSEWYASSTPDASTQSGIRIAWAREKISSLMNRYHQSANNVIRQNVEQKITLTALQHHLVSRFTSFVAVDVTPTNTSGMLYHEKMKNNLPHGWKNTSTKSNIILAQTATGSRLSYVLALLLFISATFLYLKRNNTSSKYANRRHV